MRRVTPAHMIAGSSGAAPDTLIQELRSQQGKHDCVQAYWEDKVWICTPLRIKNLIFKWPATAEKRNMLVVERAVVPKSDQASADGAHRAGFFHMHQWKKSFTWRVGVDGQYASHIRFAREGDGGVLRIHGLPAAATAG